MRETQTRVKAAVPLLWFCDLSTRCVHCVLINHGRARMSVQLRLHLNNRVRVLACVLLYVCVVCVSLCLPDCVRVWV